MLFEEVVILSACCSFCLFSVCVCAVWGHRDCESQDEGDLPAQVLTVQLFLQRCATKGKNCFPLHFVILCGGNLGELRPAGLYQQMKKWHE